MDGRGRNKRFGLLVPLALFAGALVPRMWALDWGLPTAQHVDEPALLEVAMRMLRDGTLNPRRFVYPSLPYELFAAAIRLSVWWSNLLGDPVTVRSLPVKNYHITTAPAIFIWSRGVTALLAAATVPLLWALGRRMFDWRIGLLAALLLAISQFHVRYSHYITPDAPTGLFVVLALLGAWRVATTGDWRGYLLAGAGVGLSAGYKYNAGVVAIAVALAHAMYWKRALLGRPLLRLCASGLLAALVFLATTPYAILDSATFLAELRESARSYAEGSRGDFNGRWDYRGYALWIWNSGLFAPGCAVAALGLPLVIRRYPRAAALLLVTIGAETLLLLSYKVHYLRNVLPVYPLIVLLACAGAAALADWASARARAALGRRRALEPRRLTNRLGMLALPALAIAVAAPHLAGTIERLRLWSRPYTLVDAVAQVGRLPRGMRVAAEVQGEIARGTFNVDVFDRLTEQTREWYRANGFRYLIVNEDRRSTDEGAAYDRLVAGGRVVFQYPPRRAGVQLGPGAAVLDLGEHVEEMKFARQQLSFDDKIALLGYEVQPGKPRKRLTALDGAAVRETAAGQGLQINLFWRALGTLDRDYTLSLSVLDGTGRQVAQQERSLRKEDYPTSRWQPGELVIDLADLPLPPLDPGAYRVLAGLRDPAGGQALLAQELLTFAVAPAAT